MPALGKGSVASDHRPDRHRLGHGFVRRLGRGELPGGTVAPVKVKEVARIVQTEPGLFVLHPDMSLYADMQDKV